MIHIIGRVTKDLEVQKTATGKSFISFDVAENKGYGEHAKTQFHQCTIWGDDLVDRIVKAKVQKGSLLEVVGEQEVTAFKRNNGDIGAGSNVNVWHWQYVSAGSKKAEGTENAASGGYNDLPTEDCDDGLPV